MYNIIPFILILVSLSVIIMIVVKKFSVLANLDVKNIKSEREARFKERMISNRIKRNYRKYLLLFSRVLKPATEAVSEFIKNLYKKLINLKEEKERETDIEDDDLPKVEQLFLEADELIGEERFIEAEKKYIEIISQDSKNILAFKKLGKVYFDQKNYTEAKQTLEHALRLTESSSDFPDNSTDENYSDANTHIAGMYFELALICRETDVNEDALTNIDKALSLEPNNPRYLDAKFDLCVIAKDKNCAVDVFEKLKETDPKNQKLDELRKVVESM
jgi:tetratricopeptide (TPR) repeat protein